MAEILTTERRVSWSQRLEKLKIDEVMRADYNDKNTVRASIGNVQRATKKRFKTEKESETVLKITRIK